MVMRTLNDYTIQQQFQHLTFDISEINIFYFNLELILECFIETKTKSLEKNLDVTLK